MLTGELAIKNTSGLDELIKEFHASPINQSILKKLGHPTTEYYYLNLLSLANMINDALEMTVKEKKILQDRYLNGPISITKESYTKEMFKLVGFEYLSVIFFKPGKEGLACTVKGSNLMMIFDVLNFNKISDEYKYKLSIFISVMRRFQHSPFTNNTTSSQYDLD